MLALWIASSWVKGINVMIVAMLGCCVMFLPGVEVLDVKTFLRENSWDAFFLVGSVISIANYFLFFGKDVLNVIPQSWRWKLSGLFRKKQPRSAPQRPKAIPFDARPAQAPKKEAPYTHRCTVCGRTDVSNPELEFRYCSRCKGYYCYCQEHINSHAHVE